MNINTYLEQFSKVWEYIQKRTDLDTSVSECSRMRGYLDNTDMQATLATQGIAYIDPVTFDLDAFKGLPKELGLYSKEGKLLLSGRYVLPIRDMLGNVLALVGWYPDSRKYITTNSALFSKATLFYGMEHFQGTALNNRKDMVIVEGIFDRLAVESKGVPAMATMGAVTGGLKKPLYRLMGRIVAIPDMDKAGQRVIHHDIWGIGHQGKYLRWNPELQVGEEEEVLIKDIDSLCNLVDRGTFQEIMGTAFKPGPERYIKLDL